MNSTSKKSAPRFGRFASLGLAVLALLGTSGPAEAVVTPPSGKWEFTLYKNAGCEGTSTSVSDSVSRSIELYHLFTLNNEATSWSFCNYTGKTALIFINLYTDSYYGGTNLSEAAWLQVPTGQCFTKNHITPNDAVSSYKLSVTLSSS